MQPLELLQSRLPGSEYESADDDLDVLAILPVHSKLQAIQFSPSREGFIYTHAKGCRSFSSTRIPGRLILHLLI
jgi:hypothetical protein